MVKIFQRFDNLLVDNILKDPSIRITIEGKSMKIPFLSCKMLFFSSRKMTWNVFNGLKCLKWLEMFDFNSGPSADDLVRRRQRGVEEQIAAAGQRDGDQSEDGESIRNSSHKGFHIFSPFLLLFISHRFLDLCTSLHLIQVFRFLDVYSSVFHHKRFSLFGSYFFWSKNKHVSWKLK